MDVLDSLHRRMSDVFDRYFGQSSPSPNASGRGRELCPRDILRRLFTAMEASKQEGLDGLVYVPNVYTLQVAVESEAERDYLRTFLSADELASAVAEQIEAQGYGVKGTLLFTVEEQDRPLTTTGERVRIRCRFDPNAAQNLAGVAPPSPVPNAAPAAAPAAAPVKAAPSPFAMPDHEDATVPAARSRSLATLSVTQPGQTVQTVPLTLAGLRIGRSRQAGNDLVLDGDSMASKKHARLTYEKGQFTITDEGSTNGTLLKGATLPAHQATALTSGDEIVVGQTRLIFRWLEGAGDGAPTRASAPMSAVPVPTLPASGAFRLVAGDGTAYRLASEMTVGSAVTEDIHLLGGGVSSRHARLTVEGDVVHVVDLNSSGGTFVNGERIPASLRVSLFAGDQVAFGDVLLHVEGGR